MASRRYELSDEQWDRIKQYFEVAKKNGRAYKNVRNTVNGIVWILKSGALWRDLPSRYGDWNAVYKCFSKCLRNWHWSATCRMFLLIQP